MPLEVRELIIRTQIAQEEAPTRQPVSTTHNYQQLVQDCVQRTLKALKKKQHR